jgi:hypothetical protein
MMGVFSIFGLLTMFLIYTYFRGFSVIVFDSIKPHQSPQWYETRQRHRYSMAKELWLRQVVIPPLRKSCYSAEQVCSLVDSLEFDEGGDIGELTSSDWADYLKTIGISLLLSLPGSLFAWHSIRPPTEKRQKDRLESHESG